jgi:hypothetical protein
MLLHPSRDSPSFVGKLAPRVQLGRPSVECEHYVRR